VNQDHDGTTPLMVACQDIDGEDERQVRKKVAAVRALLAEGADIDARDKHGSTALHWALYDIGHPRVARVLIDAGANVRLINDLGQTPLMLAGSDEDMVRRLLKVGANPLTGSARRSAWTEAVKRGDEAVLKRFRRAGFEG
jgi:ankyrin repeat protein